MDQLNMPFFVQLGNHDYWGITFFRGAVVSNKGQSKANEH